MKASLPMVAACAVIFQSLAGDHPQVLVISSNHDAIRAKIETQPWAREAYGTIKSRVDEYLAQTKRDSNWLSSRLFLHWTNHYTTAVVEKSRWVGGEGRSPVPTVRFAGARDWVTKHSLPQRIEDFRPYNEHADGRIWLINNSAKQGEWVAAGTTGRQVEIGNARIMQAAADAAFVYWITGDEAYARMAADALWTYTEAFSHVTPPRIADNDRGLNRIIGLNSFEVIHEEILPPLGLAYDFLHDFLLKQGRDVRLIQRQIKRIVDRVIEGGGREGNWNLNQAFLITYPALAMEDNASYSDGHGRQYYVDVLLNADLPAQRGLLRVIAEDFDEDTALWPEAPGYGFGTTPQIIQIASLLGNDPKGQAVLKQPILTRAILAQLELLHPNGWSIGLGDTYQTRVNAAALELMIAYARRSGDAALEDNLTVALQREIASGQYKRESQASLAALTRYVPELKSVSQDRRKSSRTYFGKPLNVVLQRNFAANPDYAMSAAMYGTDGGHVHANGLAIELYGSGVIMGADPGRGSSYWQPDHSEYYSQPPAHNTVIVNGHSTYPVRGGNPMRVDFIEPSFGDTGLSPSISFVQTSFDHRNPRATQQRTLAVVRVSDKGGFYFDVFRSHATDETGSFHDYIYHNVGQSLALQKVNGETLPVESTALLASADLLPGYKHFRNEQSIAWSNDFHGTFSLELAEASKRAMNVWMAGAPERKVFSLTAPANRAGRDSMPATLNEVPMPTLLVRQQGQAWSRPFVAVYEPSFESEGTIVTQVRSARTSGQPSSLVATVVRGNDFSALLLQDDQSSRSTRVEDADFSGQFGCVIERSGVVSEVYLGSGHQLGKRHVWLRSFSSEPIQGDLRRAESGWLCSLSAAAKVGLVFDAPAGYAQGEWTLVQASGDMAQPVDVKLRSESISGRKIVVAEATLAAGRDQVLTLSKRNQ